MSSEIEKRKPLRDLVKIDPKPELDEVMLHPRIRWRTMGHRPIYSYRYNSGFMAYISFLVGMAVSIIIFLLYFRFPLILNSLQIGFLLWLIIGVLGSLILGFVITHLLFFTSNNRALKNAGWTIISFVFFFFFLYFGVSALNFIEYQVVDSSLFDLGIFAVLLFVIFGLYVRISKRFGRIKLFSDGFVIGSEIFDYSEIEYINYAAGPIESNIRPEHKALPRIIMSEIEYSYKGNDYEIDHFYLVAVKQQKVFICQSIMYTSGFAANARNGLKHYNYMREKDVLYKIYR